MTPTFGAEPLVGLNPLAIAVPTREEPPFIYDGSMSSIAGNKVRLVQRLGRDTMPGWIAGEDGAPIMEEQAIPEPYLMLPLGGTREIGSHKGYGLAVMVEVLTSLLSGGAGGPDRRVPPGTPPARLSHRCVHRPRSVQGRHGRLPAAPA